MSSGPSLRLSLRERNAQKEALSSEGSTPLFNSSSGFKVEYHGCEAHDIGISDSNNNRQTRTQGKLGGVEKKSDTDVQVKHGADGNSVISIGDEHFGLKIETNLVNTNVVVNTNGETQVISEGKDGSVNIEKKNIPSQCVEEETEQPQLSNEVVIEGSKVTCEANKGGDTSTVCEKKEGTHTDIVTTTKTIGDAEITETKKMEVKDEGNVHTEKKTTVTEVKTPGGGGYTRKTFESKSTVGPGLKTAGKIDEKRNTGAKRGTLAERRAKENKCTSVKNNPFKQQEVKKPVTANFKISTKASALPLPGSTTSAKVDAATSNIDKLLKWIQKRVNQYPACDVTNFTTCWEDGIAMCALMNYLLGDEAIDPAKVTEADKETRFKMALDCATENGVPNLLRPDELARGEIDRKSMITYLHAVYTKLFAEKKEEEEKKKKEEEKK